MSLQPLVHSLYHWYYLPLVNDIVADLETATCAYLGRFNTFRPTKGLKRKSDKFKNKKNDEGEYMLYFP